MVPPGTTGTVPGTTVPGNQYLPEVPAVVRSTIQRTSQEFGDIGHLKSERSHWMDHF
jgi:hypothetical protein